MHEMDKPKYIAKGVDYVWCDLEKFMSIFNIVLVMSLSHLYIMLNIVLGW